MNKEKTTQEEFNKAVDDIKKASDLDNDSLLSLYGYYKQVTIGDCNIDKPGFFDPKGRAKWDAWTENKGMDKETAMKRYVRKVNKALK
jgi:diazepam-binding inhibitor (GABA receptor modulating acyl-CoA-binding protein)